jgi:hypothetical protein
LANYPSTKAKSRGNETIGRGGVMAKVTIELTDTPDGEVHVDLTADPPMEDGVPTPAQAAAIDCLKGMAAAFGDKNNLRE